MTGEWRTICRENVVNVLVVTLCKTRDERSPARFAGRELINSETAVIKAAASSQQAVKWSPSVLEKDANRGA